MALIKRADANEVARSAFVLDLGDLHRHGERMREQATQRAEEIVRDANLERERLISDARDEGYKNGFAEGVKTGRAEGAEAGRAEAFESVKAELEGIAVGWREALQQFLAIRDDLLLGAREDVVRLGIVAAERVTKRAIEADPACVVDQMAAVVERVANPTRLTLAVHPEDEPLVSEALPAVTAIVGGSDHLSIESDAGIGRGSCLLRTKGGGAIDASVRTQLSRIAELLIPGGSELLGVDGTEDANPERVEEKSTEDDEDAS